VFSNVASVDGEASSCNDSAASKSEVPGGGDLVVFKPEEGDTYFEWQAGVLRAERPAVKAIWRRGR
jgi:hypothetical protein